MKRPSLIKPLSLILLLAGSLDAAQITLSEQQRTNWQIKTQTPTPVQTLPLGEFIFEVATPPSLLTTISLPYDANVKKLFIANYEEVKAGQVLAEVSGTEWIEAQQKAISEAIELRHHTNASKRKMLLCNENIIPKKECEAANAELEADKIRIEASKALLHSYGAGDEMIDTLLRDLILSPTIPIVSTVDGRVIALTASPGKTTPSSEALFIIKKEGELWLETDIEASRLVNLKEGQVVNILLAQQSFDTTILQLSPTVNPVNQTRHVRILVPKDIALLSGYRATASINLNADALMIDKTSLIYHKGKPIVFIKNGEGFDSYTVKIIGEETGYYYVAHSPELDHEIATTSVAVLKNLLGESDE